MTTFEQDGYNDAINGRSYSPPTHPQTGVFAAEYQRGYNAAKKEERDDDGVADVQSGSTIDL